MRTKEVVVWCVSISAAEAFVTYTSDCLIAEQQSYRYQQLTFDNADLTKSPADPTNSNQLNRCWVLER